MTNEQLEKRATKWVNQVAPTIYKSLERADIPYSEDIVCECLADGFRAGYLEVAKEVSQLTTAANGAYAALKLGKLVDQQAAIDYLEEVLNLGRHSSLKKSIGGTDVP